MKLCFAIIIALVICLVGCIGPDELPKYEWHEEFEFNGSDYGNVSGWAGELGGSPATFVSHPELVEEDKSANYSVSSPDEERAFSLISDYYDEGGLQLARTALDGLKQKYPKGHYIVVRGILDAPDMFPLFAGGLGYTDVGILVHEYVHVCGVFGGANKTWNDYFFCFGDYGVLVRRNSPWFPKSELFSHIAEPTPFDETYLKPTPGSPDPDVMNILDELNAYSFSMETTLMCGTPDSPSTTLYLSDRVSLIRTMYHLQLYFSVARTEHPETWGEMVSHKGFACFVAGLWNRADRLAQNTSGLAIFSSPETRAAEAVTYAPENLAIMHDFFSESGCTATGLRSLSEPGVEVMLLDEDAAT